MQDCSNAARTCRFLFAYFLFPEKACKIAQTQPRHAAFSLPTFSFLRKHAGLLKRSQDIPLSLCLLSLS
jgi:hypothetical protein